MSKRNICQVLIVVSLLSLSLAGCIKCGPVQEETIEETDINHEEEEMEEQINEEKEPKDEKKSDVSEDKKRESTVEYQRELEEKYRKYLFEKEVERVKNLIIPSIVYGTLTRDDGSFLKGETVEVYRDKGNGASYYVYADDGREGWVKGSSLSIPDDFETNKECLSDKDIEFYANHIQNFESKTEYVVWIDLNRQLIYILKGKTGVWQLEKTILCATGRNLTPTIRGTFEVNGRGKRFGGYGGAANWVRFYGNYLMHSVLLDSRDRIIDNTLGKRVSHGCVRMSMEDSQWVYDHILDGTTVWIN